MKAILFSFVFTFFLVEHEAFAQSVSAYAGSAVEVNTGDDDWTNEANAIGPGDDAYARCNNMDDQEESHQLNLSNFGISIPDGSTIDGVEVTVEWYSDHNNRVDDEHIFLIDETGSVAGSDRATNGNLTTTENQRTFGGNTDLWGLALTEAIVEDPDFGCSIVVRKRSNSGGNYDAWIDFVQITVYYTVPPTLYNEPGSGNCLNFDGVNDHVLIPSTFPKMANQSFTMTAWIYPEDGTSSGQRIWCDDENNSSGGYALSLGDPGNGRLRFFSRGTSPISLDVASSEALSTNQWYHVAIVNDASTNVKSIYINGNRVAYHSYTGDFNNATGVASIGGETDASSEGPFHFDGRIDEVTFWNTALLTPEIRALMCKKQLGSESNLIAYWRFDEPSGLVLADHSSTYHGTLDNMHTTNDWVYSGAALGDNSSYLYPLSGWTGASTLTLTSPAGQDALTVSAMTGTPDGVHVYGVTETPNVTCGTLGLGGNDRYYGVFLVNGTAPTYTATYDYSNNPYVSSANETNIDINQRTDNSATACAAWSALGATLNMPGDFVEETSLSGRNEFIITSATTPLPIELVSFEANLNEDQVDLKWVTSSEINNDYFTIERSTDGKNWEEVLTATGAGNSSSMIDYFEVDYSPLVGLSYYRLKQTDFNGDYTYSAIVPVSYYGMDVEAGMISLFPSPVKAGDIVNVKFNNIKGAEVLVMLRDIKGREFYSKIHLGIENGKLIGVPINQTVPAGIYLITASSQNQIYSQKLIVK